MPPNRHERIKENRESLYRRVLRNGFVMPSCSRCRKDPRRVCVVSSDSDRCAECIRAGGSVKCDVWGPSKSDWAALEKTEKDLADAWAEAQAEQQRLFERLSAQQAKLMRLNKQREMFRARAAEMLRRGLKSLDELDAVEAEEALRGDEALLQTLTPAGSADALGDPPHDPLDFSGVAFDADPSMSPSFWDSIGVGGETSSKAPGN